MAKLGEILGVGFVTRMINPTVRKQMDIAKRIRELRQALKLSQVEFAKRLGKTRRTIQLWESGNITPPENVISLIEQTFSVNPEWLRHGRGEMFKPRSEGQIIATPEFVIKPIPLIAEGEAGLGQFIPNLAEPEEIIWFPVPVNLANHRLFFVKVKGNSMEPRIFEEDIVLVDKDSPIAKGDLVAAILKDGELVIKRYWKDRRDGTIILESINHGYPPIIVKPKDLKDIAAVRFIVPKGHLINFKEE